jgi:hypothetical protein
MRSLAVDAVMLATELRAPRLYIGGRGSEAVRERLIDSKYQLWITRFNLGSPDSFADARREGQPGDLLVVLISGEDQESLPEAHLDLLPMAFDEVRKRARAGRKLEVEHRAGALRVVLLAAPNDAELAELARETKLLDV